MAVIAVLAIVALVLGILLYRQTTWGSNQATLLKHVRATATVQTRESHAALRSAQANATREIASSRLAEAVLQATATVQARSAATGQARAQYTGTAAAEGAARTLKGVQATATTAIAGAAATQSTLEHRVAALLRDASPTGTPTPDTPYLQICHVEDLDQYDGICRSGTTSFFIDGWKDIGLAFVIPSDAGFGASAVQWRVFKSAAGGGFTLLDNYTDNAIDPQNPGFTWLFAGLYSRLPSTYLGQTPETGRYKLELLDNQGTFVCSVQFTLLASPFRTSNAQPTDTPYGGDA